MPHTYTNFLYHIVFSTKDRFPFITDKSRSRLYAYMGGTVRNLGGVCLEIGGIEDHVHLLVRLKPTHTVPKLLQDLKPGVTHWALRHIHRKFEWQNGYGAFTVGESQVRHVRSYIEKQAEHHKNIGFDKEIENILTKSRIHFDKDYLWK